MHIHLTRILNKVRAENMPDVAGRLVQDSMQWINHGRARVKTNKTYK